MVDIFESLKSGGISKDDLIKQLKGNWINNEIFNFINPKWI